MLCARACGRPSGCLRGCVEGWGWGRAGGCGCGGGWGRGPAQKCLRPAKGAPDREHPLHPRPRRSSGFLEAECGGARGPPGGNPGLQRESGPRPPTPGGAGRQATALSAVGCEGPAAGGACGGGGRALKERGGKKKKRKRKEKKRKAYSTRYSQAVSHPSTNQARPCLASEIRRDRARSGWYGRRRGRLPPGALRALRCACLSLRPAARPSRPQHKIFFYISCKTARNGVKSFDI